MGMTFFNLYYYFKFTNERLKVTIHNGYSDNGYSDNFAALGASPNKSHTNFIGYSDIIIGYSDNSCTDCTKILDF